MKRKFKICAIAKDEGAYLSEWVFHHHYFGFDSITVYVNRTTDNSNQILEKLKLIVPGLDYEVVDWIDFCNDSVKSNIQNIAYAYDINKSKSMDVDYWLPIDIDEFWTPSDFSTKINDFVNSISIDEKCIAFPWYCELGSEIPFSQFSPDSKFYCGRHVKTLVPKPWENIRKVRVHKPILRKGRVYNPFGDISIFDKGNPQKLRNTPSKDQKAYIVHRMYRSEVEYLSMLYKPQVSGKTDIKTNRQGYRSVHSNMGTRFDWPIEAYNKYMSEKREFMQNLNAEKLISYSQDRVLSNAYLVEKKFDMLLANDENSRSVVNKAARGTRYDSKYLRR